MSAQPSESRFDFNPSFAPTDYAKHKDFFQYLGAGVIILILITIGAVLFADIQPRINEIVTGISGYLTNVYTEIISVVVTILILDRRAQNREEKRRVEERNQRLVREIGSKDNATASNALAEIKELNLLKGDNGLLQGRNLTLANLQDALLGEINLRDANLMLANLEGAYLREGNLQSTFLWNANLQGAFLWDANLQNANLSGANLEGAKLVQSNLQHADLERSIFTEQTLLPDNTQWTPETDMTQFTDPQHLNFWQPAWARTGFDNYQNWLDAGAPNPEDTPTE